MIAGFLALVAATAGAPDPFTETIVPVPSGYTIVRPIASCNGTNDQNALQNALNALRPYQALVLPLGNCGGTKQLQILGKSNVAVMGRGRDATTILARSPSSLGANASGALRIVGGSNVLVANLGVRWIDPGKRGGDPKHACFAATVDQRSGGTGKAKDFTFDNVHGQNCKSAGLIVVNGTRGRVQNVWIENSKADALHFWASDTMLVQGNLVNHAGDDCLASIGGGNAPSTNFRFLDNTCKGGGWAGGGHADNSLNIEYSRNLVVTSGVSCMAVSNDGNWSGSNPSNHILIADNVCEDAVTRTETGHGTISIYTCCTGSGTLGPDIVIKGNQVRSPRSGPGFRQWGPGDKRVALTDTLFCGLGSKPAIRVLTGTQPIQSGNVVVATCPARPPTLAPVIASPPPTEAVSTGERG